MGQKKGVRKFTRYITRSKHQDCTEQQGQHVFVTLLLEGKKTCVRLKKSVSVDYGTFGTPFNSSSIPNEENISQKYHYSA